MSISFRQSILCLLGVSLCVTLVIGGIGGYFMLRNARSISYQYENTAKAAMYVEKIRANCWRAHSLLLQMGLDRKRADIDAGYTAILKLRRENAELLQFYSVTESGPEEIRLYRHFEGRRFRYLEVHDRALELALASTDDRSIEEFNRFNTEMLLPVFRDLISSLDILSAHIFDVAAQSNVANAESSHAAFATMLGIIAVSVILLLLLTRHFFAGIFRLAVSLTGVAASIADNRFDNKIDEKIMRRKDEFGIMARALDSMQHKLDRSMDELAANAETLADFNEELQKASRYKSLFLARMSHEMRTPLNAVIGMAHIGGKSCDPAIIADCLEKISMSSRHLLGIINDILDMSKIEAGKFELAEEEFNLERLLMDVCAVAAVKTDEKEQNLAVALGDDLPARLVGDRLRLSQVLTNILGNAAKFTPRLGTVRLEVSRPEKGELSSVLRFAVSDTGIGMSREQISRLFIPFEQADGGTARQFGGTGLGLAICDQIVRLMGGEILVESEAGRGSSFTVSVRLKNAAEAGPLCRAASGRACEAKVLLLDKDPEQREFFAGLFARLGLEGAVAAGVQEALNILGVEGAGRRFDLGILDWSTLTEGPEGSALALREKLGEGALAALAPMRRFSEVEAEAARAGIRRFLAKPVFPSALLKIIEAVMGADAEGPDAAPAKPDFGGRRVLVAEDVAINREIVFAYLEDTGLGIDVAENGVEALEKYLAAGSGGYDLLLMDIHMPLMDGYTAVARIRAEEAGRGWRRTPIVAMTANAFKEDVARCLKAGMDAHLGKPLSAEALYEIMERCFRAA